MSQDITKHQVDYHRHQFEQTLETIKAILEEQLQHLETLVAQNKILTANDLQEHIVSLEGNRLNLASELQAAMGHAQSLQRLTRRAKAERKSNATANGGQ